MENENRIIFILVAIAVSVFLLILLRLARFAQTFRREKRLILDELRQAEDYNEYRYWRRELRCHYLCLIPFVNERNVAGLYHRLFHRAKHSTKEKRPDGILHILAPSFIGICVCAVCLCGASWAWFTATTTTGTTKVQSATFQIENVELTPDDMAPIPLLPDENGKYESAVLSANTYTLRFQTAESSTSSKGYCCITVFENGATAGTTYYTANIDDGSFTLTLKTTEAVTVKLEPIWGDVQKRMPDAALTESGATISIGSATQNDTAAPNNTITVNPSAEEPTSPTTPDSTPAQEDTTAPESSASTTAPAEVTQPDSTTTAPTTAPTAAAGDEAAD